MQCLIKRIFLSILSSVIFNITAYAAVDINTASQADLENVKGFGPVKAKAIIDYREKHGHFKSIEELDNVSGIGPGTISKVRKTLSVTAPNLSNNTSTKPSIKQSRKTPSTTSGVIDEFSPR
jgi:competence protein ComEA